MKPLGLALNALAPLAVAVTLAAPLRADDLWNNGPGVPYSGWVSQYDKAFGFDAQSADDFIPVPGPFGELQWRVTRLTWTGLYVNVFGGGAPLNAHYDFNVLLYRDDGSGSRPPGGPGDPTALAIFQEYFGNFRVNETSLGPPSGNSVRYSYDASFNLPLTLDVGTKYWLTIQGVGAFPPEWFWEQSGQQQLHTGVIGFPFGFIDYWTDISAAGGTGPTDLAFQLFATPIPEPATAAMLTLALLLPRRRVISP